MTKISLVKRIHMDCPLCNRVHELEVRKRIAKTIIKGEMVEYEEKYLFCVNADEEENEFEIGSIINDNLLNARNAYRIKKGLLTSDEIIGIREEYGLSQVDLARLLGWGEATISRYESKAIQDEAYDVMLRLIKDNPLQALEMLNKNHAKFTSTKIMEIREKIVQKMNSHGKEFLTRKALEGEYAYFNEPCESNGMTTLNIDKIEAMISYIAERVAGLFKVKLMKMLWYADAEAFKETGFAISGMVYRHGNMGALPIGHYSLMNLEKLNVKEEESIHYDSMMHIYPTVNMDYSVLNDKEIEILNKVIHKFKDYKAKDIVDYMHEEEAYKKTKSGDIIPFGLAKQNKAL